MRLIDIETLKILPAFMRADPANQGLSAGVDEVIKLLMSFEAHLSTWTAIDDMDHEELDELAWELNIPWYDPEATEVVKREIIKKSDLIQQKLGTKWAVEDVFITYFGDAVLEEWWEYNGEPGHFRIKTTNPTVTNENLNKCLAIVSKVKRLSAYLDGIYVELTGSCDLFMGVAYHEVSFDTIQMGKKYT